MHEVTTFQYQSCQFRSITLSDELWFVAKDVCDILEHSNPTEALRSLDDEDLTSEILRSGGQNREMRLVSEPGLYHLILKSQTAAAKKFKRWVTHEVLPQIRKTGTYSLTTPTWSGQLTTDKLQEVAFATRNAAMIVRGMGFSYNRPLMQRLVNDMVIESTGYDLLERLRSTGLLPEETHAVESDRQMVADFVGDCCDLDEEGRTSASELYGAYSRWQAQWNKSRPMSRKKFGDCLSGSFDRLKSSTIYYLGISLRQEVLV